MKNQFKIIDTFLDEIYVLEHFQHSDERGVFLKFLNTDMFNKLQIHSNFTLKELYLSKSKKNVLRGMHFQKYPYGTSKLISVIKGKILDVVVGIGKNNFGKIFSIKLDEFDNKMLFVPSNYAHGFLSLSNKTEVLYGSNEVFKSNYELSLNYSSIDFDWPVINPIVSERDKIAISLQEIEI